MSKVLWQSAEASERTVMMHGRTHGRTAQLGIAAQYITGQLGGSTVCYNVAQHSTAQHSTAQHSTVQHSTAQHSTRLHSTAQRNAAQHSTAQHKVAQRSTAQHSTAQGCTEQQVIHTCSKGSSGGSRALRAISRVARLGRSMTRESSTACHSIRVLLREDPTSPITCAGIMPSAPKDNVTSTEWRRRGERQGRQNSFCLRMHHFMAPQHIC